MVVVVAPAEVVDGLKELEAVARGSAQEQQLAELVEQLAEQVRPVPVALRLRLQLRPLLRSTAADPPPP